MGDDVVRVLLIEPDPAEVARWRQRLADSPRARFTVTAAPSPAEASSSSTPPPDRSHDVAVVALPIAPDHLARLRTLAPVLVILAAGHDDARRHPLVRDAGADYLVRGELEGDLPARVLWQAHRRGQLEAKLDQARKLQAVGHLARGLAHEFNNLLTGIIGYTELLQQGAGGDDMLEMALPEIIKAAQRLGLLTQQLRAYGRRQGSRPGPFDLNAVLRDLRPDLERQLGPGVRLTLDLGTPLSPVKGDATTMETILAELLQNSREATEGRGEVTVRTRVLELTGPLPTRDCLPGTYVALTVHDTGQGMTEDTARRAFEPFFTTRVTGSGSGLGLTVVQALVKQMNGFVTFESPPDHGITVAIYLPVPVLLA